MSDDERLEPAAWELIVEHDDGTCRRLFRDSELTGRRVQNTEPLVRASDWQEYVRGLLDDAKDSGSAEYLCLTCDTRQLIPHECCGDEPELLISADWLRRRLGVDAPADVAGSSEPPQTLVGSSAGATDPADADNEDDGVGRLLQNQEARDAVRNEESSEVSQDDE